MNPQLSETSESILLMMNDSPLGTNTHGKFMTLPLLEHHFGEKRMKKVRFAIRELTGLDYIELFDDEDDVWKLTPYGKSYLSKRQNHSPTVFSNINNSNIAHNSPDAKQTLNYEDLDEDIKSCIKQLEKALKSREPSAIKSTFGYLTDKSIDVAIGLLTGTLAR